MQPVTEQEPDKPLHLKIIVLGFPEERDFSDDATIEHVLKACLPESLRAQWSDYELRDRGRLLEPVGATLEALSVKDDDTLSLAKKDGGGGT